MSVNIFQNMLGVVMTEVSGAAGDDLMEFTASDGRRFQFFHEQSCCESVGIESVDGDLSDLIGSPILQAEEVSDDNFDDSKRFGDYRPDSYTWTFYKFATVRGSVTVRWLGTSNGYYGESVNYHELSAVAS